MLGAVGSSESIGYTLYYATNFIFTGLAVAVAFHAGLFNIGGEGSGLYRRAGLRTRRAGARPVSAGPADDPAGHPRVGGLRRGVGGANSRLDAGWRGSHIVITTIMFNFVASALMVYMMVNVLIAGLDDAAEPRLFEASAAVPSMQAALQWFGIVAVARSPLNLSLLLALLSARGMDLPVAYALGYGLRTMGHNPEAPSMPGRTSSA